jgi:hypothetical protein
MKEENENEEYLLDGKKIKPILIKNDITNEMKTRAFDLAFESLEKFTAERDMSDFIKQKFDKQFLPSWQCIIGMYSIYFYIIRKGFCSFTIS